MRHASSLAFFLTVFAPSVALAQPTQPAGAQQPEPPSPGSNSEPATGDDNSQSSGTPGEPAEGSAGTSDRKPSVGAETQEEGPAEAAGAQPAPAGGNSAAPTSPAQGGAPAAQTAPLPTDGPGTAASAQSPLGDAATPAPPEQAPLTQRASIPDSEAAKAAPAYAEDWWRHSRPILEFHGYFRTRAEMFHQFSLGRREIPSGSLWAPPTDKRYLPETGEVGPRLCTGSETDVTKSNSDDPKDLFPCDNNFQQGANLRLRLNPEIHVSDNLRIRSQVDLLDNLVLGSSPEGLRYSAGSNGLEVRPRSGYTQLGFYDGTQVPPDSGSNNFSDSVRVKRAWGEYTTPVAEVRFGRMPHHWGMGMLYHSGDGYDDDYQSTVDRLMVSTRFRSLDLTLSGAWDFPNEGPTTSIGIPGAQPYDSGSKDDVNQYAATLLYQKDPELEKLSLARGGVVVNTGLYFLYRSQTLANDQPIPASDGGVIPGANRDVQPDAYARRHATSYIPDFWFQLKYDKFRFELEAAAVYGEIGSPSIGPNAEENFRESSGLKLQQFGIATELEQLLVEDKLRLGLNLGWASGDPDAYDPSIPGNLIPGANETQINDDTVSTFRFHPSYRVDLILNRNILQRIQGTYYIRPSIEYDFIRDPRGQRAGGGIQAIWTRASEFVQTPGHDADLGLELNATLYFQARDGSLNDTPDSMGGFYSALQYGVLFPLDGMGYPARTARELGDDDVSTAQILRLYLGILF